MYKLCEKVEKKKKEKKRKMNTQKNKKKREMQISRFFNLMLISQFLDLRRADNETQESPKDFNISEFLTYFLKVRTVSKKPLEITMKGTQLNNANLSLF